MNVTFLPEFTTIMQTAVEPYVCAYSQIISGLPIFISGQTSSGFGTLSPPEISGSKSFPE